MTQGVCTRAKPQASVGGSRWRWKRSRCKPVGLCAVPEVQSARADGVKSESAEGGGEVAPRESASGIPTAVGAHVRRETQSAYPQSGPLSKLSTLPVHAQGALMAGDVRARAALP